MKEINLARAAFISIERATSRASLVLFSVSISGMIQAARQLSVAGESRIDRGARADFKRGLTYFLSGEINEDSKGKQSLSPRPKLGQRLI